MRILVVEDEPSLAGVIARHLREHEFAVDIASTARDAVTRLRGIAYNLVVLDIMLPDQDGFEVCRQARASGVRAPILVLSARHQVEDRVRGLDVGADDYLTKPFDFAELTARIRALIRRAHAQDLRLLAVADLTLDPVTRIVKRGERRIDLTTREFALLDYLMRNAGQPVTRPMLAEHVWNFAWHRLTNVIDVFINHLRKKIEAPGEPRLLHAVRGVGYVIREPRADD